jgi:hypothetical protein
MRAVIYLDVDGVLNRLGPAGVSGPDEFDDFERHRDVDGFDLQLSRDMVSRIADLPADVLWLTTWRDRAPAAVAPLVGAPPWPWLDYAFEKVDAVIAHQLPEPRPYVWIDDMDAVEFNALRVEEVLAEDGDDPPPRLLVNPDPFVGLTRSAVDDVGAFCRRHDR